MPFERTDVYAIREFSDHNNRDIKIARDVIDAFWEAVDQDPQWGSTMLHPIECCILSALAVRDILHDLGHRDAVVLRMGLDIRVLEGSEIPYCVNVGSPAAEKVAGRINAHMVVRLGNLVIDPTIGQTKRHWNEVPRSAISQAGIGNGSAIEVGPKLTIRALISHKVRQENRLYQVTYFKLPYRSERMSRNWKSSPDASPVRRAPLVKRALNIMRDSMPMAA